MELISNNLSGAVIGAAIEVHREVGPGLLESAYQHCLVSELHHRGLSIEIEKPLPLTYKGGEVLCGYRADIVVENRIIVEIKAVDRFHPINEAQMITYLRLSKCEVGLLINFNVKQLIQGLKRIVLEAGERGGKIHRGARGSHAERSV